jgi:transcriptional/translational regulatory protein YebC/TACO1
MLTKSAVLIAILAACTVAMSDPAAAQGRRDGTGPVASQCAGDIDTYCGGLKHGNRAVRECLSRNRDRVAPACRSALDNTGGGQGMGRRWQ